MNEQRHTISIPETFRLAQLTEDYAGSGRWFAWLEFGDHSYVHGLWFIARGGYGDNPQTAIDAACREIRISQRSDLIHWLEQADAKLTELQHRGHNASPTQQPGDSQLDHLALGPRSWNPFARDRGIIGSEEDGF